MTQNEYLISTFKAGRKITTLQAHRKGICRLSERCRELEKAGHKIKRKPIQVKTRYGNGKVRVMEYGF